MKTNSSFHAAGEVATQPAWGTGEQAAQPLNGSTSRFAMSESSLADLLQKAASQYPNRAAYKFIDYDTDPAGFTETVTWWQVHRRAMIVAEELWIYASSGDRVAILPCRALNTSSPLWVCCRLVSLRFLFRCHNSAFTTNEYLRHYETLRRPLFLRPRRLLTRSRHMRHMRAPHRASPRPSSWLWTLWT